MKNQYLKHIDAWDKVKKEEIWEFRYVVLRFLLPRVKLFRKNYPYTPHPYSKEVFDKILDEMVEGFELELKEHKNFQANIVEPDYNVRMETYRKIDNAWRLLGEHISEMGGW